MRAAIVDLDLVVNVILLAIDADADAFGAVLCPDEVEIGWSYVAGAFVAPVESALPPAPPGVPDGPTLSDWRVGMTLWGRLDEVTARVTALIGSDNPAEVIAGKLARERLEYANHVLRADLIQLADVFGFSEPEVDESLWRADRVRQGDIAGVWPLPAG